MSKKYFCVSDTHSFYTPLVNALKEAGYNKKNKDHILVVLGDIFDRGNETNKLYKFLKSIPKSRRVLIRGNHDHLYFDLLNKNFPEDYDFSNGTVKTFCDVARIDVKKLEFNYNIDLKTLEQWDEYREKENLRILSVWEYVKDVVKDSEITKFLKSDEWVNYFELGKYIMTHSFIPVDKTTDKPFENWRDLDKESREWYEAMWGAAWLNYDLGRFKEEEEKGKVLVCGHWQTSDFFKNLKLETEWAHGSQKIAIARCPIYKSKHLIALDSCTVLTNRVNVLVIDEEEIND